METTYFTESYQDDTDFNFSQSPQLTFEGRAWRNFLKETNRSVDYLDRLFERHKQEFLETHLGPKQEELASVVIMTIVYSLIFLSGLIGNISTCAVVLKNKFMQTTTNYYLLNVAISDLFLLLLGLPTELYSFWSRYPWIFGESFCFIRNTAAEACTLVSILTITAFTVERYLAICHPLNSNGLSNVRRVLRIVTVVWIVAVLCSIPQALQFGVVYKLNDSMGNAILESAQCTVKEEGFLINLSLGISTFLFFLLPMTILTILYFLIGLAIKKSIIQSKRDNQDRYYHSTDQIKARSAVIKMLVAVVVAFFICWTPFHTQRLVIIFLKEHVQFHHVFYKVSGVFYYLSATINPILYSIMSRKFRKAFKTTCTHKRRSASSTPHVTDLHRPDHTDHVFIEKVALHNVASKMVSQKPTLSTGCNS